MFVDFIHNYVVSGLKFIYKRVSFENCWVELTWKKINTKKQLNVANVIVLVILYLYVVLDLLWSFNIVQCIDIGVPIPCSVSILF